MSELKAYIAPTPDGTGLADYYLKSEADAYIEELKEKHKKEVKQLLILNREQANAANELRDNMEQALRHHKYHRCLDKAKILEQESMIIKYRLKNEEWLDKWHKRWLELAEEPTWEKFLQLIHKEAK